MSSSNIIKVDFARGEKLGEDYSETPPQKVRTPDNITGPSSATIDKSMSGISDSVSAIMRTHSPAHNDDIEIDPIFRLNADFSDFYECFSDIFREAGIDYDSKQDPQTLLSFLYYEGRALLLNSDYEGANKYFNACAKFHPDALFYSGYTYLSSLPLDSVEEILKNFSKIIHSLILTINDFDLVVYKEKLKMFKSVINNYHRHGLIDCPIDLSLPISREELYEALVRLYFFYSPKPKLF